MDRLAPLFNPPFSTMEAKQNERYSLTPNVGRGLCLFLVLLCVYWVTLYTFNPTIIQAPLAIRKYAILGNTADPEDQVLVPLPDVGRCYIAAIVLSLATTALIQSVF